MGKNVEIYTDKKIREKSINGMQDMGGIGTTQYLNYRYLIVIILFRGITFIMLLFWSVMTITEKCTSTM